MEWLFYIVIVLVVWAIPALIVHGVLGSRLGEQQRQLELLKAEMSVLRQHMLKLRNGEAAEPQKEVSAARDLLSQPSSVPPQANSTKPVSQQAADLTPLEKAQEGTPVPPVADRTPPPVPPVRPRPRSTLDQNVDLMGWLLRFFTGERALVRLGVLLVLLGMGFLLKLTVSQDLAVPLKLLIAASCSGILFGWGWYVRKSRKVFSVALQGGALGILYFMVYASSVLYGILPFAGGLLLWLLVGVFGGLLALRQNAQVLAVLSVVGGFLAAMVMRTGNLNFTPDLMLLVFGYYTLLNAGIVWLSFLKLWRSLNVMGYMFTFLFSSIWGILLYRPEHYSIAQPFLIVFFVMYTLTPLLHALRRQSGRADHVLLLTVPVLSLLQETGLLAGSRTGVAISSLIVAGVQYGIHLFVRKGKVPQVVSDTYLTLAIGFGVLAVPLLTTALATSAIWTLNGVLLTVFGVRSGNRVHRIWGLVLLYLALAALWLGWLTGNNQTALLSSLAWVSVALVGTGIFLQQKRQPGLARGLLVTGATTWIGTGIHLMYLLSPADFSVHRILLSLSVSLLVLHLAARQFEVAPLSKFVFLLPAWAFFSGWYGLNPSDPSLGWDSLLAWTLYFLVQYFLLGTGKWSDEVQKLLYLLTTYLLFSRVFMVTHALLERVDLAHYTWVLVSLGFYWFHVLWWKRLTYTRRFADFFRDAVMLPLQLVQAGVFLMLITERPRVPYLPFLNLLEVAQLALFLTLYFNRLPWTLTPTGRRTRRNSLIFGGVLGVSGMIVRFMHAHFGVPWDFYGILDHNNTQTVLSIFWSVVALVFTVHANRSRDRDLWTIGAGILAFVVLKLFVLDLSGSDTWARVISFLGVGLLLLFMGFVAPVPPRIQQEENP